MNLAPAEASIRSFEYRRQYGRVELGKHPASRTETRRHRLEQPNHKLRSVLSCVKGRPRLGEHIGGKLRSCPKIRKVGADEIERARERLHQVTACKVNPRVQPVLGNVARRNVEGFGADVGRPYLSLGRVVRNGDGDAGSEFGKV